MGKPKEAFYLLWAIPLVMSVRGVQARQALKRFAWCWSVLLWSLLTTVVRSTERKSEESKEWRVRRTLSLGRAGGGGFGEQRLVGSQRRRANGTGWLV